MRIHRLTHASPDQIKSVCQQAGIPTDRIENAIDEVTDACSICARTGYPSPSKKISLTHVNEAFNIAVQIYFAFEVIRGKKRTILVITDIGTAFTEGLITENRNAETISTSLQSHWIMRHGIPTALSADDEYNKGKLRSLLQSHNIVFKARPTRRHNNTGKVERKIQTLKGIIQKIDLEISVCSAQQVVTPAFFLSNFFSGSRIMSSFQLARGYQPSILGIPATLVSADLLTAHVEQSATSAIQKAMRSYAHAVPGQSGYKEGDIIWVWYKSPKGQRPQRVDTRSGTAHFTVLSGGETDERW